MDVGADGTGRVTRNPITALCARMAAAITTTSPPRPRSATGAGAVERTAGPAAEEAATRGVVIDGGVVGCAVLADTGRRADGPADGGLAYGVVTGGVVAGAGVTGAVLAGRGLAAAPVAEPDAPGASPARLRSGAR